MPNMVIANTLKEGTVVFLTGDGSWVAAIADGELAQDQAAADILLAAGQQAAANDIVIDPQLIEVNDTDHGRQPTAYREYIRAYGPSVKTPGE
jgi:hypothetical protein